MKITPLHIEILHHYYTTPSPFPRILGVNSEYQEYLCRHGILEVQADGVFKITERGKAWMHDILNTPFPQLAYIGRDGNVIKEPD